MATATVERQKGTPFQRFHHAKSSSIRRRKDYKAQTPRCKAPAKALLGRAKEALGDTELRAGAAGVVTERELEIGQVVDAGQSAFTLAQDGDRDAIFDVDERILLGDAERGEVALRRASRRELHHAHSAIASDGPSASLPPPQSDAAAGAVGGERTAELPTQPPPADRQGRHCDRHHLATCARWR